MGRLCANGKDRGGIVLDAAVLEREADRALEGVAAILSGIPHTLCDEGHEEGDSLELIVGDLHEDQEERLLDGQEIVVRGLSFNGRKGIPGLLEQEGDRVGRRA